MTIVRKHIFTLCCLIALYILSACNQRPKGNEQSITLKVIEIETNKWAYRIERNEKTFIYQDCIPAIGGNKPFLTKEDAQKTGKLVIEKIINNEPPTLSIDEVKSLELGSI